MPRSSSTNPLAPKVKKGENPFKVRANKYVEPDVEPLVHVIDKAKRIRCDTEKRGHSTPEGRSPLEIAVDASEGFIPLWAEGKTLRWSFRESSLQFFADPAAAKAEIKTMIGEAMVLWGDAAPVKLAQRDDNWDFEVIVRQNDDCDINGCVLASAFFPDGGRHQLTLYPKMFEQEREEQVETLIHEIGHIFGLRHFFALIGETAWPAEIFGEHDSFSIMNYGALSELSENDKSDLKKLYALAWSGELTKINGTPIRFMTPFHESGEPVEDLIALEPAEVRLPTRRRGYARRVA